MIGGGFMRLKTDRKLPV